MDLILPIQLDDALPIESPVLEMLTDTQTANHLPDAVFQCPHGLIIQVIPMIMRNNQVIDIRHILRVIHVRSLERLVNKRHRGGHAKHQVHEYPFPIHLNQIRRIPEPHQHLLPRVDLPQIRFHHGQRRVRLQPGLILEKKIQQPLQTSFVRGH